MRHNFCNFKLKFRHFLSLTIHFMNSETLINNTKVDNVAFKHTRIISDVNQPAMTSSDLIKKTDIVAVILCCK